MKANLVAPVLAICALATSAAPAAAVTGGGQSDPNASCVGHFASFVASAEPGFGQGISEEAQASMPFGYNTVAPFAHERLPCP